MKKHLLFTSLLTISITCAFAQWAFRAPMAVNTGQHGVVAHPNGNIYVFGGFAQGGAFNTLNIYNEAGNTWSPGANLPQITRGPAYCLGPDSMVYSFGGFDPGHLNYTFRYNTSTNTWSTLTPMPTACWYAAAATAPNGKIYVIGGENAMSNVQIYDPVQDTWSSGTAIPIPVKEHAAVCALNGKIYVIGGLNQTSTAIGNVQVYDPVLDSWTTGTAMPTVRNEFAYTLAWDGMIYCIGGKINGGNNQSPFYTVVEIYNPVTDTWTTGPILPKGLGETACASINLGINVFGGADSSGAYSNVNLRLILSSTGVEESEPGKQFLAYPNPASDKLYLAFGPAMNYGGTITITDLSGKLVYQHQSNDLAAEQGAEIDVRSFSRGFYLVNCMTPYGKITHKLVLH